MRFPTIALSLPALLIASCGSAQSGDSATQAAQETGQTTRTPSETVGPFAVTEHGTFDEPWGIAFAPGTEVLFITEKGGTMKFVDLPSGRVGTVSGVPEVAYGGQVR